MEYPFNECYNNLGVLCLDALGGLFILEFKPVTLAQKPLFESYLSKPEQRGSECAFSNLLFGAIVTIYFGALPMVF